MPVDTLLLRLYYLVLCQQWFSFREHFRGIIVAYFKNFFCFGNLKQAIVFKLRRLYKQVAVFYAFAYVVLYSQVKGAFQHALKRPYRKIAMWRIYMYPYNKIAILTYSYNISAKVNIILIDHCEMS